MRSDWPPANEVIQGLAAGRSGQTLVTFCRQSGGRLETQRRFVGVKPSLRKRRHILRGRPLSPMRSMSSFPAGHARCELVASAMGNCINELNDHAASVSGISFSHAGDHFATASSDGSVRVFEFPTGKIEHHFLGHQGRVWQVAWSPAGDSIASVGSDGTLRVWDLQQGSSRRHLKMPADRLPTQGVGDFAFLQDGQHVNAAYDGGSLIWNVKTGQSVSPEKVPGPRLRDSRNASAGCAILRGLLCPVATMGSAGLFRARLPLSRTWRCTNEHGKLCADRSRRFADHRDWRRKVAHLEHESVGTPRRAKNRSV